MINDFLIELLLRLHGQFKLISSSVKDMLEEHPELLTDETKVQHGMTDYQ
jgi:hypothetical protein